MAKRRRDRQGAPDPTDWASERTLADAEADAAGLAPVDPGQWSGDETVDGLAAVDAGLPFADAARTQAGDPARTDEQRKPLAAPRCACGSEEFVLEAFLAVIGGRVQPAPLEVESLTCPQCGRDYEAVTLQDGRVVRGEFRGQTDLEE